MEWLSIGALVVSLFALISSFMSNRHERESLNDQVYQRFAQMWFDMDQVFINHPEMHKYFYKNALTNEYAVLNENTPEFELALCISEMFCDVFQYSEPLEKYLTEKDRRSYRAYKKMIMDSPVVKVSLQRNHWN